MTWLEAPPDVSGQLGVGWDVLEQQRAANPDPRPEQDATLAMWVLHSKQHPAWEWYWLTFIHLRPMPEQSHPPILHFPAATHEMTLLAIDPAHAPPEPGSFHILSPANVVAQVTCSSDELALAVFDEFPLAAVRGFLPIEGLYDNVNRSLLWRESFDSTLEHVVTGGEHA